MTSRTTAPTKAPDLGRKEHDRSGSSAIPTTTASWVGQLDCRIWGRRTYELFHGAHCQTSQRRYRSAVIGWLFRLGGIENLKLRDSHAVTKRVQPTSVRIKSDFDQFRSFLRAWCPLPLAYGI